MNREPSSRSSTAERRVHPLLAFRSGAFPTSTPFRSLPRELNSFAGGRSLRRLAAALLLLTASSATAQLPVFSGDPVDSHNDPYVILPGLPLILPGDDKTLGTSDDEINLSIIGDVDVVARTGGTYAGSGPIPAAHAGIVAAPATTAITGDVAFQMILSDGATSPTTGNPLLGNQQDDRAALVVAFPDLDGDGYIGPYAGDGSADLQIERQEAFSIIGRQAALIHNGVASGNLAVNLGAPASHGGLGTLVGGGVLMGTDAPEYLDGVWVGTRLPILPPLDYADLIGGGGGVRPPPDSGEAPIEIKTEFEKWLLPSPTHPLLGGMFAIPTDGSSPTVDLARVDSGAFNGAAFALPIATATFVADAAKRVIPAINEIDQRQLVEPVDSLILADDGPGNGRTIAVYAADRFGNATDADTPVTVVLETTPGLTITSPDADSDPHHETILFDGAGYTPVTLDDSGTASDGGDQRLLALVDGVPTAALDLISGAGPFCGNGVLEGTEACDDGNETAGDGCEPACTITSSGSSHDAVVLPPRPLSVRLAAGTTSDSRTIKVKVRNADTTAMTSNTITLTVDDGDCPAGTAGAVDFDSRTAGTQNTIELRAGASAKAEVTVELTAAAFSSVNHSTPTRCRLLLTASGGGSDPTPSNDTTPLEISVIDFNDAEMNAAHESFVDSLKPVKLRLAGRASKLGKTSARVGNGDVVPSPESGHTVSVTIEGNCPLGSVGPADFDRATVGSQSSTQLAGGDRAKTVLPLTIQAADFAGATADAPVRCLAYVRATGPGGDSDSSNDAAVVVIDVAP